MKDLLAKRREVLLGLMLVLLAAAVWRNLAGGGTGAGSVGAAGALGRVSRPDLATLRLYPVDWAALERPRPSYDPNGRNIFQFGTIPPPPPPVLTPAEQAAIRKAQELAQKEREKQAALLAQQQEEASKRAEEERIRLANQPPPPPPPPPKPQPPPVNYKFIGYFGPADRKIAVLHDGTDIVFVKEGEVLPKGIRVLEIGYESIKFGFAEPQFKDESRTLPMSSSY
jgi:hypothetical protein